METDKIIRKEITKYSKPLSLIRSDSFGESVFRVFEDDNLS